MSTSLQVLYPIVEGTNFDYDYYLNKHMPMVGEAIGEHIQSTLVTKGVAGGPDTAAGYYQLRRLFLQISQRWMLQWLIWALPLKIFLTSRVRSHKC